MSRRFRKQGFTLVELLVVIAIIGILVALLLPAVQAAREAARRTECNNKVKQLGLALHNHHDAYLRFPPGCANDRTPFGNTPGGGGWGSSWKVYILPYLEMSTMYDKWVFDGNSSGYTHSVNMPLTNQVTIKTLRCPSSAVPERYISSNNAGAIQMMTSYTGTAGAYSTSGATNKAPFNSVAVFGTGHGVISWNGVLSVNSQTNMRDITDGTSNCFMAHEESRHIMDGNNRPVTGGYTAITSQGPHGWTMGAGSAAIPTTGGAYNERQFNCSTVRYRINQIGFGNGAPTHDNTGTNIPISSYHPGGAHVAMGDGAVKFLTNSMDFDTLARLAVMNDGDVVNAP